MSRRLPYVALCLLAAVAFQYDYYSASAVLRGIYGSVARARLPMDVEYYGNAIVKVQKEAVAAGVLERDRLLEVDGVAYTGSSVLSRAVESHYPGGTLTVRVAPEEGVPTAKTVSILLVGAAVPSFWETQFALILGILMPTCCLVLGFAVAFLRPRDRQAWILLGMMVGFACMGIADPGRWPDLARRMSIVFRDIGINFLWPASMLLFGIYFPERLEYDRKKPWAKWLLIVPLFLLAVLNAFDNYGSSEDIRAFTTLHSVAEKSGKIQGLFMMASISLFFALLGYKKGTTQSPDARRRLRLLVVGGEIGLTPSGIFFVMRLFVGNAVENRVPFLAIPAFLMLFIFPATLAYVIVVHRALDVRVAIRQGFQYTLARGGVRVLLGVIIAVLIFGAVKLMDDPTVRRPSRMFYLALGVVVVVRLRQAAEWLRKWIDRRFFREAVDTEKVLGDLADDVRGIAETKQLLETVARRLSECLHVPRIAVLLDSNGRYCPVFALGYSEQHPQACIAGNGPVATHVQQEGASRVYLDDPESWIVKTEEVDPLRTLDTQLLLPLVVKDRLPGIISLGPKQSEEPYSASDLRLLQSVATQTGLALENTRLTAAVAAEAAQRERLNREIEIAREVQERLFPQNTPGVQGLDYCGHCRPALGVGGDYYDFVALPEGKLGIAIGDVSGKGIAAALLMASLQASLRGQTLRSDRDDLSAIMRNVNKLVFDASSSNRYATFFYAQYDPATHQLSYVNAGHNPPAIIRGAETLRLEAGGAVVGLLPDFPYGEGEVQLQSGDILVLYTDGISEAMDPEDNEWGEDAMIEAARESKAASSRELLEYLFNAADAFARGAKQHDDMTLVVARVA